MKKPLFIAALMALAATITMPMTAAAESDGWYAGLEAGLPFAENTGMIASPLNVKSKFDPGFGFGSFLGYDFGDIRAELEASYRSNGVDKLTVLNPGALGLAPGVSATTNGRLKSQALMLNGLWDVVSQGNLVPYLGIGLGLARVHFDNIAANNVNIVSDSDGVLAYQGIAGVRYVISEQLSAHADYRYMGTTHVRLADAIGNRLKVGYDVHSIMVGLTWRFEAPQAAARPAPPPPPAPVAAPEPEPEPIAEPAPAPEPVAVPTPVGPFIVFFDWDKADITPEADQIIRDAAAAARKTGQATIETVGHADRSGTVRYNKALSQRRAVAVKNRLLRYGIDPENVVTKALGESHPLVPTADGVREPQNRRVEIIFP
jgi:outer membrane protein OmpA-like peptidoglycan-associated protein